MKKNLHILVNENGVGGTISILDELRKIYCINIIDQKKLLNVKNGEKILAIQPKSILKLMLFSNRKNIKDYYLFDSHPYSLGFINGFIYIIAAIILLHKSKRCLIPYGPLASFFPFSKFIKINWLQFVNNKFVLKNEKNEKNEKNNKYIYLGTISKKKNFKNCIKYLEKNNIDEIIIYGYLIDKSLLTGKFISKYKGSFVSNLALDERILIWTSKIESYGLIYREYIESGGKVLFLRKPNKYDFVQDGVYICDNSYDNISNLVSSLLSIANQKNVYKTSNNLNVIDEIL